MAFAWLVMRNSFCTSLAVGEADRALVDFTIEPSRVICQEVTLVGVRCIGSSDEMNVTAGQA